MSPLRALALGLIWTLVTLVGPVVSRAIFRLHRPDRYGNDVLSSLQTVAVGDTAVLYCSFDAIYAQLPQHGLIDWVRLARNSSHPSLLIAHGNSIVFRDKRYRVYRPHRSALSVLIIRKAKKKDAGSYRCHVSRDITKHRFITLHVTESKMNVVTGPSKVTVKPGRSTTLWCNASGVPQPMVYWKRIDTKHIANGKTNEIWGTALTLRRAETTDTGTYACYLDNYVQPVQSYQFNVLVEERPWDLGGYKMRFDSTKWNGHSESEPRPVLTKSFLLMCETEGEPRPLPTVYWYRDGKRLRNSRRYYILEDRPSWRPLYMSSTLVIKKFMEKEKGTYTCEAGNIFGIKKQDFELKDYELTSKENNQMTAKSSSSHAVEDNNEEITEEATPGEEEAHTSSAGLEAGGEESGGGEQAVTSAHTSD